MTTVTDQANKARRAPDRPSGRSQARGRRWRPSFSAGWLVFGLATALFAGFMLWQARDPLLALLQLLGEQEAVSARIQAVGVWGPLVLIVAQVLQVLIAVIPGHVFLVAAGYAYGFGAGFLLNLACIVFASQIAFALARRFGRPLVDRLVAPRLLDRWYTLGQQQGFIFLIIAFLLPIFPTDLINFVAGLNSISGRKFLAANILGRLPGAAMLTLIGSHGMEFSRLTWIGIGAVVALVYIGGRSLMLRFEPQQWARRPGQSEGSA